MRGDGTGKSRHVIFAAWLAYKAKLRFGAPPTQLFLGPKTLRSRNGAHSALRNVLLINSFLYQKCKYVIGLFPTMEETLGI
jgi:hypothetical protein